MSLCNKDPILQSDNSEACNLEAKVGRFIGFGAHRLLLAAPEEIGAWREAMLGLAPGIAEVGAEESGFGGSDLPSEGNCHGGL